jgi:hypothetical protein
MNMIRGKILFAIAGQNKQYQNQRDVEASGESYIVQNLLFYIIHISKQTQKLGLTIEYQHQMSYQSLKSWKYECYLFIKGR